MGIGVTELLIILVIVALLFGTKKLRSAGGDLGAAIGSFRQAMNEPEQPPAVETAAVAKAPVTPAAATPAPAETAPVQASVAAQAPESRSAPPRKGNTSPPRPAAQAPESPSVPPAVKPAGRVIEGESASPKSKPKDRPKNKPKNKPKT